MVFEHIEKLKQEYTDKYVIVDGSRPELRRFGGLTGTVRTVNMSGRALVEFDAYNNIGWYDIDVDFLKVIDQPLAKPEAKPAAKAAAKASPKAAPTAKKDAPAAKSAAGMSMEEMLAAARANKGGGAAAAPAKTDPKGMSVADVMAAARTDKGGGGAAAPAPAKKDPKAMSVEEMLAAARGETSGGGAPAAAAVPAAAPTAAKKDPKAMSMDEMLAAARGEVSGGGSAAAAAASAPPPAPAPAKKDPKAMSMEEMLAAARGEVSGGGGAAAPAPAAPTTAASGDDQVASVRSLLEAGRKPKPGAPAAVGKPDDLKLIKGIGPKIESLLHEAEITTFAQLASQPVSRLTEILDASGSDRLKQIANEQTWPEQAAAFASGVAPAKDEPAAASAAEETATEATPDESAASGGDGPRKDITSVEEQVAYCRQVDGG